MNKRQMKKLASIDSSLELLKSSPVTGEVPGLAAEIAFVTTKRNELDAGALTQAQRTEGHTAQRDVTLGELRETTLDIANALARYAHAQGRDDLLADVQTRPSEFDRAWLAHRPLIAERVHAAGVTVVADAAVHGVTADMLAEFKATIVAAKKALAQPRTTLAQRKAATRQVNVIFGEIDERFEAQIDRLLFRLRKTEPEFYAAYLATRRIGRTPGRRTSEPEAKPMAAAQPVSTATTAKLAA